MKKYLIVLAAAVMALTSCGGDKGNKYTSLSFKDKDIEMTIGETAKLKVRWEPTTLDAPVCVWKSSNEEVVAVDQNGNIEALAEGEANITATTGEGNSLLEAVCHVTVKSTMEALEWTGWSIWNFDDETPLCDTVEIELKIGKVKAVMYPAKAYVWDQNITPVYETEGGQSYFSSLSGAGFCLEVINMPIYVISEGDYKGYYVGSDYLYIVDADEFNPNDTAFAYCAVAGKRGDAQKFYQYLTEEESGVEYEECITGTELSYIDWDAQKGYYWFGLGGEGIYAGDEAEIYYRSTVDWFINGQTGLKFTEDGEDLLAPGVWAESQVFNYEKLPEQSAAKKNLHLMKPVKRATPLMQKKAGKDAMNVLFNK